MKRVFATISLALMAGCGGLENENQTDSRDPEAIASDRENMKKIKQIASAAINYHDTRKLFPFSPAARDKGGFKDLSWRVKALACTEFHQHFDKIDPTKSWDDKSNAKTLKKCQEAFILSNGAVISVVRTRNQPTVFASIRDGSNNTIMLIENRRSTPDQWAKPDDLNVDEVIDAVSSLEEGDFLWVALYDGSVWKLPSLKGTAFKPNDIRPLLEPSDGTKLVPNEILQTPN